MKCAPTFLCALYTVINSLLYPWYVIIVPMYTCILIFPSKIWAKVCIIHSKNTVLLLLCIIWSVWKKSSHCSYNKMVCTTLRYPGSHGDWNARVWTMTTSLYLSVGTVDAAEWTCALCGCHFQNDWANRAMNLHQILH